MTDVSSQHVYSRSRSSASTRPSIEPANRASRPARRPSTGVAVRVAQRIGEHEDADAGDQQRHDRGEAVEPRWSSRPSAGTQPPLHDGVAVGDHRVGGQPDQRDHRCHRAHHRARRPSLAPRRRRPGRDGVEGEEGEQAPRVPRPAGRRPLIAFADAAASTIRRRCGLRSSSRALDDLGDRARQVVCVERPLEEPVDAGLPAEHGVRRAGAISTTRALATAGSRWWRTASSSLRLPPMPPEDTSSTMQVGRSCSASDIWSKS